RRPGRTRPEQITLFKNNAGQGVADVALGALVLKKAEEKGLGTLLEL
ncbi:MAG: ornithine cyclodeaminase family protein, partial [Deltaproteobacteria bacterium]|nr:ornithine cyclodeaminase family protein [Deltaproteobacteria bacterium]